MFEEFINDYSNTETSVIVMKYKGKGLILQRGSTAPWMPNAWSLVGGGIDEIEYDKVENGKEVSKDKKAIRAAIRETWEETKIAESFLKNVKFVEKLKTKDIGTIHYFIADVSTDKVKLDYENSDYKFITKDEIDNYEFVPYVKEFLEKNL